MTPTNPSPTPEEKPLMYEETPEMTPIEDAQEKSNVEEEAVFSQKQNTAPKQKKSGNFMNVVKIVLLFVVLFFLGFWVSGIVRQYLNAPKPSGTETPTPTPTMATISSQLTPPPVENIYATWKSYPVLVASTRQAYPNLSFMLPPEVTAPTCDGTSCASQGTYLPGGSRFTVALRGKGQALPDYRGKLISDIGGKTFTTNEVMVNGNAATEFTGTFSGGTVGGYAFSQMHGYMIDIGDQVSLEINHFTPTGIRADFASDDELFGDIVNSISAPGMEKGMGGLAVPTVTPTPASTVSAQNVQAEMCQKDGTTSQMTYTDAVVIASKGDCALQGKLKDTHFCNSVTGTWWIDLDVVKEGCSPACVVDVANKTATVNWRCTGLSQ